MKLIPLITILLLIACTANGSTWFQTIEYPSHGDVLTVDIGVPIVSIESVSVHVIGWNIVGGYSCDSMEGSYYLPEIHFIEG